MGGICTIIRTGQEGFTRISGVFIGHRKIASPNLYVY